MYIYWISYPPLPFFLPSTSLTWQHVSVISDKFNKVKTPKYLSALSTRYPKETENSYQELLHAFESLVNWCYIIYFLVPYKPSSYTEDGVRYVLLMLFICDFISSEFLFFPRWALYNWCSKSKFSHVWICDRQLCSPALTRLHFDFPAEFAFAIKLIKLNGVRFFRSTMNCVDSSLHSLRFLDSII